MCLWTQSQKQDIDGCNFKHWRIKMLNPQTNRGIRRVYLRSHRSVKEPQGKTISWWYDGCIWAAPLFSLNNWNVEHTTRLYWFFFFFLAESCWPKLIRLHCCFEPTFQLNNPSQGSTYQLSRDLNCLSQPSLSNYSHVITNGCIARETDCNLPQFSCGLLCLVWVTSTILVGLFI